MNPALTSGITGASPIWNRIMTGLLTNKADVAFQKPDDVAEAMVDGNKDLVLAGKLTKSVVGQSKTQKDNKDSITFTDPFSTYVPDQPVVPAPNP